MTINLSGLTGNSTKEKIIALLSSNWPLSAKKIYRSLIKDSQISITYQATHKALTELAESKVLEKRKEGYLIGREWIKKLGEFSEKTKEGLEEAHNIRENKTTTKLVFDSHADFVRFHLGFVEELLSKEKNIDMRFYFRHVPYSNALSRQDIEKIKPLMSRIKWSIFSKSDTLLDRWFAKYWKKLRVSVKTGQDIPTNCMMVVMNSYIMNIYLSKEALEEWDKLFSVKSLHDVDMNGMTETILNQKYKTLVLITQDKEAANLLRYG